MRTIDDRLTQASSEARSQIAAMELQDRSTVERRVRSSRILAGATAVVLVFGAFGVTALLVGSDGDQGFAPGAGGAAPPTSLASESDDVVASSTLAPTEPVVEVVGRPKLGLDPDEWLATAAGDLGVQSFVVYESKTAPETVSIEILTDERGRGVGYEYSVLLEALRSEEGIGEGELTAMDDVVVYDGSVAKVFGYIEPNGVTVTMIWQHSDTVTVFSKIHAASSERAIEIAGSIAPLSDYDWNLILENVSLPEGSWPTTTMIAPQP